MHIQRLHQLDQLAPLADSWNRLAQDVPFRSWDWAEAWWRNFHDALTTGKRSAQLFCLAVDDDDQQLRGIAPWYLDETPTGGRTIRFMAGDPGETVCPEYLGLVCDPDHTGEVVDAISNWLDQAQRSRGGDDRWDILQLGPVDDSDQPTRMLVERLSQLGCAVHERERMSCWRLKLPETWDDYLGSLSKSHRKNMRQLVRRNFDTGQAIWHPVVDDASLEQGLEILQQLHQRRWESLGEPGCFASPRFCAFLHQVSNRLLKRDALRMGWVELDGRPIAIDFAMAGSEVTFVYQGGVDPDALDAEPGRLCAIGMLQTALAEGRGGMDFLRGDLPYKAHLRAQPRRTVEFRVAAKRIPARLRHRLWVTGETAKQFARNCRRQLSGASTGGTTNKAQR